MKALMNQFNDTFNRLPSISEELEKQICQQNWPPLKERHARLIVGQLPICNSVSLQNEGSRKMLVLSPPIELALSPADCGIKYQDEKEKMFSELRQYLENLLIDLNHLSVIVRLYLSKFDAKNCEYDKPCNFSISLEF